MSDHPNDLTFLGVGGVTKTVSADFDLGVAHERPMGEFGIRRAIWDIAYGYVNGFPIRDILWFVMTRSLSKRLTHRALAREGYEFRDGIPIARHV